jgi:hypothetical protein
MSSDDSTITSISGPVFVGSIAPGEIVVPSTPFVVVTTNLNLSGIFNFEISSDKWVYWEDSFEIATDVKNEITIPITYNLYQNYPNPFNPVTTIEYSISERSKIELIVYDVLGREIEVLVDEEKDVGYYNTEFIAGNLASGIYLYKLKAGDFTETKKMILLK